MYEVKARKTCIRLKPYKVSDMSSLRQVRSLFPDPEIHYHVQRFQARHKDEAALQHSALLHVNCSTGTQTARYLLVEVFTASILVSVFCEPLSSEFKKLKSTTKF